MEERREGLDFEISDLLQEINFEKSYNKVVHVTGLSELKPDSKIKRLIDKMLERNQELALQQSAVKEMMKLSAKDVRSRLDSVSGSVLNLTAKRMES
jgi:translation elongation factor EF-Tu-like GTPase